ncbi:heterokaryon incompatibility domain-containing protein [Trichoderma sp. SZMC 28014]
MGDLNTTAAASSAYPGPALPTPNHIRLVSLQPGSDESITCELMVVELHSNISYEALSYTWGDPNRRQTIFIKSREHERPKELLVTSNCVSALRRLRYQDRPRILWIDALSIDQSNTTERNHQVSLMATIYSSATNVAIYLGEASQDSDLAIDFMIECDKPSSDSNSLSYPKSAKLVRALNFFFYRTWFTRVWIIQEVVLPARGTAYCGTKTLSWSAIKQFMSWNTTNKWLQRLPFVVSASVSLTKHHVEWPMLEVFIRARQCEATDPRDKVYSMLSLLNTSDKQYILKPRYEDPVAKVYTDCALALMPDSGYDLLSAVQGGSTIDGLPSWVPDWSVQPKRKILGSSLRIAQSRPRIFENRTDNPESPQIILGESTTGTMKQPTKLRIAGYSCGKIAKLGSPYLAGQGIFPLHEWRSLLQEGDVADPNYLREGFFYEVISTYEARYEVALVQFVETERALEDEGSARSWESRVRKMASERTCTQATEDSLLPFTDIPFRLAVRGLASSYQRYVEVVLEHCHSRRFFITDTGYMGIGPEETEVGDEIYICVGATVPFAFRDAHKNGNAQSPKAFQLVGECYIDETAWTDREGRTSSPQYLDVV